MRIEFHPSIDEICNGLTIVHDLKSFITQISDQSVVFASLENERRTNQSEAVRDSFTFYCV